MALFNRSHSGGRTQDVSRQFTDSERVVDERIDAQVQAPMPSLITTDSSARSYAWLEQDLKRRAAITGLLGQEQDLANQQSVRRELDRKFTEDTADEADAIQATKEMNALFQKNPNMTHEEAVSTVTQGREDRWGNSKFVDFVDKTSKMRETDMEKQKREGDLQTAALTNEVSMLVGAPKRDFLRSTNGQAYLQRMQPLLAAKEERGFKLNDHEMAVKEEMAIADLKEQKIRSSMLDVADPTFEGKARLANFMSKAGIPVTNLEKTGSTLQGKKGVLEAMSHPTFLRGNPKLGEMLKASLATMERSDAKPDEIAAAETGLASVAGAYFEHTAATEYALKMEDRALKYGEERGKSLQSVHDDVYKIETESKKKGSQGMQGDFGKATVDLYEGWMKAQVAADSRLAPLYESYTKKIGEARNQKDALNQRQYAKWAAEDFAMDAAKFADRTAPTAPAAPGAPAPAAGTPTPTKTSLPPTMNRGGKDYILNPKDGKYYLKP